MSIDTLGHLLSEQWQHTTRLELIAVIFSVTGVLLAYRNHVLLYPAGLISTGIYTWLLAQPHPGLYADAALNLYYFVMSIYGWILWGRKGRLSQPHTIQRSTARDWGIVAAICGLGFILLYGVLFFWTPSTVPVMDAFVSATAWAGMWLLAKRRIENWILLNISNAVAIPLLFYKQMPLTALLTLFLFIVAVFGYYRWKRIMNAALIRKN